ncbi:hypothetical protein LOD99_5066 [Oopsacas minuta]|uniref:Alkaline ceramidase n=1 Tax=Oopsacas minuta TaxID=111878 RepID=A0AAV7JRZ2_9METZ|nr:hypothetical protein LOD99_5066 [Oopsacas minuta]
MAPNVWADKYNIKGHWGYTTSTLDWCEENYIVLFYVAEFWNTISNVLLVILPLCLIYSYYIQKFAFIHILAVSSVFTVGIGSVLFHATLLYHMQMMDELPMLIAASFLVFNMMTITVADGSVWKFIIGLLLSIFCIFAIVVYLVINDPLFHEACYGILIFLSFIASFGTIFKHELYNCAKLLITGYSIVIVAFILWNVENTFCPQVRSVRDKSGYFRPLFELHAWWHILCGLGTHVIVLSHTKLLLSYRDIAYEFRYYFGIIPYIQQLSKEKNV